MFNASKYIKSDKLDLFKKFMASDIITVESLYGDQSFEDLLLTTTGRYRSLLSVPSNKFDIENGYVSIVHYLAPSNTVRGLNVCRFATLGCHQNCLAFQGRLQLHVNESYTKKTIALYLYPERYLVELLNQFYLLCVKYQLQGKHVYLRMNGLSDLPFHQILDLHALYKDIPNLLGFYDYTKKPVNDTKAFYDVTYSWNERSTIQIASRFDSVAYVLNKKDVKRLLSEYPSVFVSGDHSDIRPTDNRRHVLLSFKGKNTVNDFVLSYDELIEIVKPSQLQGVNHV